MNWWKNFKGKIRIEEPLSRHTSLRIGGKAALLFEPYDKQDLIRCLIELKKRDIPYFIIGRGTNLLVKDEGFKGVVIRFSSDFFKDIKIKNDVVSAGSGAALTQLLQITSKNGLSGYEFLAGIPGTVGGAVVMNAGITFQGKRISISQIVKNVEVLDKQGKFFNLSRQDIKFSYRASSLSKYIILKVKLKLSKNNELDLNRDIKDILSWRKERLDFSYPNAGSIFKNPSSKLAAGALIERCGLKGLRYGGAGVSMKHANFIMNFQDAKAQDVISLIAKIKEDVYGKFGVKLREEIKIVP